MEIRRVSKEDSIDNISRVFALSWKAAYQGIVPQDYLDALPENRWSQYIKNELANLWVAEESGQIVGVSTYGAAREERYKGWGEVISIYLLPSLCRKGIGTRLLQASQNELFSMGF